MRTVCSVTGKMNCKSRFCELHYMNAPLRLVKEVVLLTPCKTYSRTVVLYTPHGITKRVVQIPMSAHYYFDTRRANA